MIEGMEGPMPAHKTAAGDERRVVEAIKRGLTDMDAGRLVPHAQVMAEARQIVADARAQRAVLSPDRRSSEST